MMELGTLVVAVGFLIRCKAEMAAGSWMAWGDGIFGVIGILYFLLSDRA